jgi:hypothetical protein
MPIYGVTTTVVTMPPVIGSLRKGGEKEKRVKGDRQYEVFGKDLTHFRFTARNESDADLLKAFAEGYGEAPARLDNVYLPGAEVDDNLMAFCEEYSASSLIHRCDGVWVYERDSYTGQFYRTDNYCPYADENPQKRARGKDGGCKQVGRLYVILPELLHAGYYGVVTVLTHSINDIAKIYQALANCRDRLGPLNRYPFTIYRAPEMISTPNGDNGRARREKWLINITPSSEFVLKQIEAMRGQAVLSAPASPVKQLTDGGESDVQALVRSLAHARQDHNAIGRRATSLGVPNLPRLTTGDGLDTVRGKTLAMIEAIHAFAGDLYSTIDALDIALPDERDPIEEWLTAIEAMQAVGAGAQVEVLP